jgi:hypothetical protein
MAQCWRDGDRAVVARDGELPESCVRCGGPGVEEREGKVEWTPAWVRVVFLPALGFGALPYFLMLALLSKRSRVGFWLCETHAAARRRDALLGRLGWLLFVSPILIALAYVIAYFAMPPGLPTVDVPWWIWIATPVLGLVLAVYGAFATRFLRATRIETTLVWVSGVSRRLLMTLPTLSYR